MSEERKKILEMLADGKINADEADRLLTALAGDGQKSTESGARKSNPKYLRILVEPSPDSDKTDKVNIRVPFKLIYAGLKLTSLIPKDAHDKVNQALNEVGIESDISKLKPEDLDLLIQQLDDISVNVEGKETVKIFSE